MGDTLRLLVASAGDAAVLFTSDRDPPGVGRGAIDPFVVDCTLSGGCDLVEDKAETTVLPLLGKCWFAASVGACVMTDEQTCGSSKENPVWQPLVNWSPLQCDSTSRYKRDFPKSWISSPRGICFAR